MIEVVSTTGGRHGIKIKFLDTGHVTSTYAVKIANKAWRYWSEGSERRVSAKLKKQADQAKYGKYVRITPYIRERLKPGCTWVSSRSGIFTIVSRPSKDKFIIKFAETGTVMNIRIKALLNGSVRDLMAPTVLGIGSYGIGEYTLSNDNSPKYFMVRKLYYRWKRMLSEVVAGSVRSYPHEWLNFQAFVRYHIGLTSVMLPRVLQYQDKTRVYLPMEVKDGTVKCTI